MGERGSLTCARCLLRGAAGVAGALPEAPMAAAAALSPGAAGRAVRISRAPGGATAHWLRFGGGAGRATPTSPPRQPDGPAGPARHVPPRPLSIFGEAPPPHPSGSCYWPRSPAPPPAMAGGRLRLGEPEGRHGEPGLQSRCRLATTRLTAPGRDWEGRGCGRCRGEPLSWRS